MPQLNSHSLIIKSGSFISDAVDLGTDFIVGMIMPNDWTTPASVSVAVSVDGIDFNDLYDIGGNEVLFNVEPRAAVNIDPNRLMLARFIKLRSGLKNSPVAQESDRPFKLIGTAQLARDA
jgi:hypothetical protein